MSEKDQQETILMAIECLKKQYACCQTPCIALLISRYYRLLENFSVAKSKQEKYAEYSKSWLTCHINNPKYSQKIQAQLNDFIQSYEPN
ncbi:MAG: hypothetical protein Q8Q50_05085 [Methylobacter sp.]|nr:hypothetical protein [Methylobacter sp.]